MNNFLIEHMAINQLIKQNEIDAKIVFDIGQVFACFGSRTKPSILNAIEKLKGDHPEVYKKMMGLEEKGLLKKTALDWYESNVVFAVTFPKF